MWKPRTLAIAAIALGSLMAITLAIALQSASYELPRTVLGGGGGQSQSSNFESRSTIGQPLVGTSNSANFEVQSGFWPGAAGQAPSPSPTATPTPTPKPTFEVGLFAEWNFQTWRPNQCVPSRQAMQNLIDAGILNVAARFNALAQDWFLFDPDAPDILNTLTELCPDNIIVLNVDEAATWVQDP